MTITEEPKYVLKTNEKYVLRTNERISVRQNETAITYYTRKILWGIIIILIVCSILFHENFFSELSAGALILLFVSIWRLNTLTKTEKQPSPLELRFYDDYFVVYKEKYYYDWKISRMEFYKFYYKDIEKCEYREISHKLVIYGNLEWIFYNYNKDGSLPENPSGYRKRNSLCCFYTDMVPETDFVKEIEEHSPIKVIIAKES